MRAIIGQRGDIAGGAGKPGHKQKILVAADQGRDGLRRSRTKPAAIAAAILTPWG
jgi:hypothetical protein